MFHQKDCNNCCSLFLRNLPHGFCVNSHSSESGRLGRRNQRTECAGADSHGRADHVSERTSAREVPRRGGGREPCHSPKYFGQPYSSLPPPPAGGALRAQAPLSLRDISPRCGESPSQRGPRGEHTFFDRLEGCRFLKTPASLPALVGKLW